MVLTSHESLSTPGKIITFWREKITWGKTASAFALLINLLEGQAHVEPRGRAAVRAPLSLLRR